MPTAVIPCSHHLSVGGASVDQRPAVVKRVSPIKSVNSSNLRHHAGNPATLFLGLPTEVLAYTVFEGVDGSVGPFAPFTWHNLAIDPSRCHHQIR